MDFADRPNRHLVQPLKLPNALAESVRAAAAAAAARAPGPIDGTVSLTLLIDWAGLGEIGLGRTISHASLLCEAGRWKAPPGGRVRLVTAETAGGTTHLVFVRSGRRGEQRYDMHLRHAAGILRGSVAATGGQRRAEGYAIGFVE